MANHKRKKSKAQRAGCLMCKPHKHPGYSKRLAAKPSDRRRMQGDERGASA